MGEPVTGSHSDANSASVSLEPYIAVLLRFRWWILAAALLGAIAGFVLAVSRPPIYEARATLVVNRTTAGGDPVPPLSGKALLAFFVNQSLVTRVLSETGLDRPPHDLTAAAFVSDHLVVEELVPGSMLQVRVRLRDPERAVKACNKLVALAIELNGRVSVEESQASQDFIKKQLEDRRLQLEDVERRLVAFKARAQIDRRREDVRAMLDARRELVDLEGRLAAERGRLAAATSELAQRTRTPSTRREANPVAAMPGAGTSSNERPRDGPLPRSTPEDRQTARPDTSPVAQEDGDDDSSSRNTRAQALLANRLGGLTDSVYEILDYEAANSRVRLAGLESRRRELSGALGLTKPALKQLTELYEYEIEQARLEAEHDLSIKLYQDLLTRLEQGRFAVAGVSSGFKLMDPAVVAAKLSRPSSRLAAMLGAAAGLGFGILAAFVLNFFRVPSHGDRYSRSRA